MANEFSWDKVLKGQEGDEPGQDSQKELQEILEAINDKALDESGQPVDVSAPGGVPDLQVVESGEPIDPYTVIPVPRELVEPEKTNPSFDADFRPDYLKEDAMGNPLPIKGEKGSLKEPKSNYDSRQVGGDLQTPRDGTQIVDAKPLKDVHIDDILREALERKASDVHFTAGLPPMARLDGEIAPLNYELLVPEQTKRILYEILTDENIQKFESTHELDFAYTAKGLARFRVNMYVQRHAVAGALRMIPNRIPTYEDLRLPPVIREIAKRTSGLILVTGPTGSGKSTTIAAMIDDINATRSAHVLTIEDPIEYLHSHKKCMVNQRELHSDTYSFHNALRAVLREDPDIILVGEMRDRETISLALTAAETGHLVFGTLHTSSAPKTIDRIIDVFPAGEKPMVRSMLSESLRAVISQALLKKKGGGRTAVHEIMVGVPAIRNLIREDKVAQMYSSIQTGAAFGMQTLDQGLLELVKKGLIARDEALNYAQNKASFKQQM